MKRNVFRSGRGRRGSATTKGEEIPWDTGHRTIIMILPEVIQIVFTSRDKPWGQKTRNHLSPE
jgi:hypothetical protein